MIYWANEEQSKINYNLNRLLINCGKQEIGGLVYYYFLENKKERIDEYYIKDKIYSKISNILPQDIIINLSERNPIKNKYNYKKRYNNFKGYIKDLEINNNYKISIIYTFTSITSIIEGCDKIEHFMISEIRTEDELKRYINDIKNKNKNEDQKKHIILINFEQYNSNKIQFISDYINNYCQYDDYNYIFIIHIQRNFNTKSKEEKIYSILNIYKNINQLFIDNLNGSNISLKDLLDKNIKEVMLNKETFINLEDEFQDLLINFIYDGEKIKEGNLYEEKYFNEIINYISNDIEFKNELIKKVKELIKIDRDAKEDCQSLVNKIFKENYINKKTIDIISCILDYIKENIFKKYLQYIFKALEKNNFLTTLIEISKDRNSNLDKDNKSIENYSIKIKELKRKVLEQIKVDDAKFE